MASSPVLLGVLFVPLIWYAIKALLSHKDGRPPLPPGPKGLPIVGNVNDLPKLGQLESHHWLKHKTLYGPISSLTVMGNTFIIVNDSRLASEIMEKRSAKYSSRPRQVFAGEMVGWENSLGMTPYNDRFRTYRRDIARVMGTKSLVAQYNTSQEVEVGHFLMRILDQPDKLVQHIKMEAGSLILKIAYGYTTEPQQDDPLVGMVGHVMDTFAIAAVPGAFLVDMMPFLKWLPDWVPGTGFKQTAREWGAGLIETANRPYEFVRHQMAEGQYHPSFVSQLLEKDGNKDPERDLNIKWAALSLYTGGADTTVSSIACFFLAMMISPEVQRKAQNEIDRVVGQDRLPTFADRNKLPYIEATVYEVLRWHPVGPMGIPHTSTEDDICEGYFIPKGALVFPNIWGFAHDPELYPDPMVFNPDRFLQTNSHQPEPDPHSFVFGFGRRTCPGQVLADNSLFLNIAQSLAVFNISKPIENGQIVEPTVKFEPGLISHPAPFKVSIKPRSTHHESLIRGLEKTYPWQQSDAPALKNVAF